MADDQDVPPETSDRADEPQDGDTEQDAPVTGPSDQRRRFQTAQTPELHRRTRRTWHRH